MHFPEVGHMGSFIPKDQSSLSRQSLGWYGLAINVISISMTTARVMVPGIKDRYPLRQPMKPSDVCQLWAILMVTGAMYISNNNMAAPQFEYTWLVNNRLELLVGLHAVMTAFYYFAQKFILTMLPQDQRPAQAANIIRIGIKLAMFCYWALSGDFFHVANTHPLELTSAKYAKTEMVCFMINALYLWEVAFRDLRPVNVIHHAIACMGFTSFMEWASVLEPQRTNAVMPILGSLIEAFCCMGSLCYRFLTKGRLLYRILVAITVFVLFAYNILAAGFIVNLYGYNNLYRSWGYGKICMPCTVLFTYPAQMNMARMFWSLSKKALPPKHELPAIEQVESTPIASTEYVRRRRQ